MRSNVRTTIATYCLLSIAGGISFIMPDGLDAPSPPRPISRVEPTTKPDNLEPTPEPQPSVVGDEESGDPRP